jgi:formate--tetrahydrofolate ligase
VPFAVSRHFADGGAGAVELAKVLIAESEKPLQPLEPQYAWGDKIADKIAAVATNIYGAKGVVFTAQGQRALNQIERLGYGGLPVCIAKTQSSLSDDPKKLGRPTDFELTVRDLHINAGAGFVVAMTGDIMRMPGLPRRPSAEDFDVVNGKIVGLR